MRGIGLLIVRRAWVVLALLAPLVGLAAVIGASAESHLSTGGFTDAAWESSRAQAELERTFPGSQPNLVVLLTTREGSVDDPAVAQAAQELTDRLTQKGGVSAIASYWGTQSPSLRSIDGRRGLVVGFIGGDQNQVTETVDRVVPAVDGRLGPVDATAGGTAVIETEIVHQSADDLRRAELITVPVTAVLLLVLFGSAVGAALPLVVGGVAVVGTLFILRLLTGVTDVSIFALNLTTGMGLGLGIDYSLLIVTRYREELRAGRPRERALVRTLQTAGRTVLFSAVTVAIALSSLLIFPVPFLRSFAYAGVGVVGLAAFAAVVVLPAVMHLLGPRIEKGRIGRRDKAAGGPNRFWYQRAHQVMRHPRVVATLVIAVLLMVGSPFLRLVIGDDDERILPASAHSRQVGDALRSSFAANPAWTVVVVAPAAGPPEAASPAIEAYAEELSGISHVLRVDSVTGHYAGSRLVAPPDPGSRAMSAGGATRLTMTLDAEPLSPAGEQVALDARAAHAPFAVLIGGPAATLVDSRDSMLSRLPIALAIVVVATFVLLFLMVGSVLVPLKTLLLNVLSLSATFGALIFIFQDGHLSGTLDFATTGTISIRTPVLLFCFAFGLSMDYEVFLISRIKEEYDRIGDNEEAVALGLGYTGRLVTSAALLIAVVFLAFLTSGVVTLKVLGLGLALAVLVDAFLIRATLVPALMKLLGARNWWAPRRLRRLHLLVGIWEREPLAILDVGVPVRLGHPPKGSSTGPSG